MGPDNLLIVAVVVFLLLLVGLALTVYEFHTYILHQDDDKTSTEIEHKDE